MFGYCCNYRLRLAVAQLRSYLPENSENLKKQNTFSTLLQYDPLLLHITAKSRDTDIL